ncbi:MAG: hypothetical protein P4K86_10975 [Terracidiphilus sp.]|nr:hypothetical protein [Terracidiphilus sp.]
MTDRLDQFADELLQKTRAGKLRWVFLDGLNRPNPEMKGYTVDIGDGVKFVIRRWQTGENVRITLQLLSLPGSDLIRTEVRNWPINLVDENSQEAVRRFRLYSDLFDAAYESSVDIEQEFDKVEELLRKIG